MSALGTLTTYCAALLFTYVAVDRQVKYLQEKVRQHYNNSPLKTLLFGFGVILSSAAFGMAAVFAVGKVLGLPKGPEPVFVGVGLCGFAALVAAYRFSEAIDAVNASQS